MNNTTKKTRKLVEIAMLGAVAAILMYFEFPLPFIAPPFYEIDLSEVPVLIGTFALGPLAGVAIEFIKIPLKLMMKGTTTVFVGDIANFFIGCAFVLPAGWIYRKHKTKKHALAGMVLGTVSMTVLGCFINAYILLPFFAAAQKMPIDAIIEMGSAVNSHIVSVPTFVMIAVAPFNLIKGFIVSLITLLLYKHVSPSLKGSNYSVSS